jgi:hypothetical protein
MQILSLLLLHLSETMAIESSGHLSLPALLYLLLLGASCMY